MGVLKDLTKSAKYFKLAADQGNAAAQTSLGKCFSMKSIHEYSNIILCTGVCYKNGAGVTKSITEAIRYLKLASDQGSVMAQYSLGRLIKFYCSNFYPT